MKAEFLFVGLNLNTIVQGKSQTNSRFMNDTLKTRGF